MKILPVFIPFQGCKNRCVYCNQNAVTGYSEQASIIESAKQQIDKWLAVSTEWNELAFYGGSFSCLPKETRQKLYKLSRFPIRFSTCPDFFSAEFVDELAENNVCTIEIGVQSLSQTTLTANGRLYSETDVINTFGSIPKHIKKGCQLMAGMYAESRDDLVYTASRLAVLGADYARIYPMVVLKNTQLEKFMLTGRFSPLPAEEILLRAAWLYIMAETDICKVIRVGLPAEVNEDGGIAGGWWHPASGELIRTMAINAYINIFGADDLPPLYGYKAILKDRYNNGLSLQGINLPATMKYITKALRGHYIEGHRWFAEKQNISFAARLAGASHF